MARASQDRIGQKRGEMLELVLRHVAQRPDAIERPGQQRDRALARLAPRIIRAARQFVMDHRIADHQPRAGVYAQAPRLEAAAIKQQGAAGDGAA